MSMNLIFEPRVLTPEGTKRFIKETQRRHRPRPAHIWFLYGCLFTSVIWAAAGPGPAAVILAVAQLPK